MRPSDEERKQASQIIKTNSIFSSLNCFPPIHFLRDFGQSLIIQPDQQYAAGSSLTRSRCCCLLPKHGEKAGDLKSPQRASCCPTPKIVFPPQAPAVLKTSSKTQTHPNCKAHFLWITPAFLFFSSFFSSLCLQTPFPLFMVIARVQSPVPIAGCREVEFHPDLKAHHGLTRAQRSFLSASSNTKSWEGREAGLSWKFPFCFHPSRIQTAFCCLQASPYQHH